MSRPFSEAQPAGDGPEADARSPLLQLLSSALQLWVRQQCQQVESLEIQLLGSALQLLRGRLSGVRVLARGVTYQDLDFEQVELTSSGLTLQIGNLWRRQPLQLQEAFRIRGRVRFSPEGLTRSLARQPWRPLADQLAEDLLGVTPLVALQIRGDRLIFCVQPLATSSPVELETHIQVEAAGLRILALHGSVNTLLPMDGSIELERASVQGGMVLIEGQAQVTP